MDAQKLAEEIVNALLYPNGVTSHAEWANRFNQVAIIKKLLNVNIKAKTDSRLSS